MFPPCIAIFDKQCASKLLPRGLPRGSKATLSLGQDRLEAADRIVVVALGLGATAASGTPSCNRARPDLTLLVIILVAHILKVVERKSAIFSLLRSMGHDWRMRPKRQRGLLLLKPRDTTSTQPAASCGSTSKHWYGHNAVSVASKGSPVECTLHVGHSHA